MNTLTPPTEQFYNVRDMIRDLKAGKLGKQTSDKCLSEVKPASPFQPEQRVTLEYHGKQREGTVKEVHAATGYVRVEIDLATMHEYAHPDRLTLVGDVVTVGQQVSIPALGIDAAEVVAIQEGAVTRYRCRWYEAAAQDTREAGFWRADIVPVESKAASR